MALPELGSIGLEAILPIGPRLAGLGIEYEVTDAPPSPAPEPLNATINENQTWSETAAPRTITITDNGTFTVAVNVAPPAWVTVGGTAVIDGVTPNASGATIVFDATPTYAQAGVYNWSYTIDDGVNPPVDSNVTLTVNDVPRVPTVTPDPASPYNLTKDVAITPIDIDVNDPDGGNVTLSLVSGSLPAGLSFEYPLGTPITIPPNKVLSVPDTVYIVGTPTAVEAPTVTLRATDTTAQTADAELEFNVTEAVAGGRGRLTLGVSLLDVARGFNSGRFRWKL